METCGTQRGGSLAEHSAPKTQRIEWEQADIPGPKVAAGANWAQKLEEGVCRLKPCLNGGWEPGQGDTGLDSLSSSALRLMPLIQQGDQPSSPQSLSSSQPGSDLVTSDQGVFLRWERWDSSWWSRECQEGAQGQDGFSSLPAVPQPCPSTQQTPPATRAHPCPPQDTKQPEPARGEQQSREVTGDTGGTGCRAGHRHRHCLFGYLRDEVSEETPDPEHHQGLGSPSIPGAGVPGRGHSLSPGQLEVTQSLPRDTRSW